MLAESSFGYAAARLDPDAGVPHLPGWLCIPTLGHTPGHLSFSAPPTAS